MLAYAAGRPRVGERRSSPNTMLIIISAHIAAVAVIISAKMDLPPQIIDGPTIVRFIHAPTPPPEIAPKPHAVQPRVTEAEIYTPPPTVPARPLSRDDLLDAVPAIPNGDQAQLPMPPQRPTDLGVKAVPVSTPAQPLTAASDLRPPYPESNLLAGEEAALTLRLTVDENGRVVAVDPIGRADPVFLSAARRHLLARWRYKPAMQDGRPVGSTVVVTLRFELDD